ncbi:MAG: hypothetical protein AAF497_16270, partial [Planctomycetota bacterium]
MGDYEVHVDVPRFPLIGNGLSYTAARTSLVTHLPDDTDGLTSATVGLHHAAALDEFISYVPIQLPEFHDGSLIVQGDLGADWTFNAFAEDGSQLANTTTGPAPRVIANFEIPVGSQRVYVRAVEDSPIANGATDITIGTTIALPFGVNSPANQLPPGTSRTLPTKPDGSTVSGGFSSSFTAVNETQRFAFQAAAGDYDISVVPNGPGAETALLDWAVYVDGALWAWETGFNPASDDGQQISVSLPGIRSPQPIAEYDFDPNHNHEVVISVTSVSPQVADSTFEIHVDNLSTELPQFPERMKLDPTLLNPSETRQVSGNQWTRIHVPTGLSGPLDLHVQIAGEFDPGDIDYRYDLYSIAGDHIGSGSVTSDPPIGNGASFLLDVPGGNHYYLRASMTNDSSHLVNVTVTGQYLRNQPRGYAIPTSELSNESINALTRFKVDPAGLLDQTITPNRDGIVAGTFWVGESGLATFHAQLTNLDSHSVALYRIHEARTNEFRSFPGTLVDFTNGFSRTTGEYSLTTYLQAGAYALVIEQSDGSTPVTIHLDIPVRIEQIVLEPNEGSNEYPAMYARNAGRNSFGIIGDVSDPAGDALLPNSYRTSIFRSAAPGGAKGPLSVSMFRSDSSNDPVLPFVESEGTFYFGTSIFGFIGGDLTSESTGTDRYDYPVAAPGTSYYVAVDKTPVSSAPDPAEPAYIAFNYEVPVSGIPDWVVIEEEISLSPNNGETIFDVRIQNVGYAATSSTTSRFRYQGDGPNVWIEAELEERVIGARSFRDRSLEWNPLKPTDTADYFADFPVTLENELDETNNNAGRIMSSVNTAAPVISIGLTPGTAHRDGVAAADVFGRFVSEVLGVTG